MNTVSRKQRMWASVGMLMLLSGLSGCSMFSAVERTDRLRRSNNAGESGPE